MPDLFSPFTLKDVTLRNRIVMSPMTMYRSPPNGVMTDFHVMLMGSRAAGGFGLVFPEQIAIHHNKITNGGQKPAGKLGELLKPLIGETFPDILWDGMVNPAAGKPSLSIVDNGAATFVKTMVEVDEFNDELKAIEKAGWVTPKDHPDLVPVQVAAALADHFRFASESAEAKHKAAELADWLRADSVLVTQIEDGLTSGMAATELSTHMKKLQQSCKDCHAKYRD